MNKNKKTKLAGRQGFTLIEVLITAGIVMFLSASMLNIIKVSDTQRGLIIKTEEVKSGVRLAQTYSLSVPQDSPQRNICGFGVHPDNSTLIVYYLYNPDFASDSEACNTNDIDYSPPASLIRVNVKTVNLGSEYSVSGNDIYFRSPYGGVYVEGGGELVGTEVRYLTVTRNSDSQSRQITINGAGKINL